MSGVSPAIVIEVKCTLDGREQRFTTELVYSTPSLLMVLYRFERDVGLLDSYGCFWPRRPYSCYHIVRPPGTLDAGCEVATRFDVVRDLRVTKNSQGVDEVHYLDLLLDLWVHDNGGRKVAQWEDEDELDEALQGGLLGDAERIYIERARITLQRRHRRVVGEIRSVLRTLGRIS